MVTWIDPPSHVVDADAASAARAYAGFVMSKRRISKRDPVLRKHVVKIRPGGFDIHLDSPPSAPDEPEHAERRGSMPSAGDERGPSRESSS